jgi:hypothetical protein
MTLAEKLAIAVAVVAAGFAIFDISHFSPKTSMRITAGLAVASAIAIYLEAREDD